jgi:PiT family inorganic phosphate transporter
LALGLGTTVGWKRVVVTVGEKIGKTHLSYAQGASAELVAMSTIAAADMFGLPVSTTHVLSSGVAGTMAANHSGLQLRTIRNIALAWVLTLPVTMLLAGALFAGTARSALKELGTAPTPPPRVVRVLPGLE